MTYTVLDNVPPISECDLEARVSTTKLCLYPVIYGGCQFTGVQAGERETISNLSSSVTSL